MKTPFSALSTPLKQAWREIPIRNSEHPSTIDLSTSDLTDYRLLILLGEPGAGKTVAMRGMERASPRKTEERTQWASCNQYSSVEDFRQDVFRGTTWTRWRLSGGSFELYIDGFDESPSPRELGQMLIQELGLVPRDELFVRIACRSAAWPSTLQEQLIALFASTPSTVGVFALQPLDETTTKELIYASLDETAAENFYKGLRSRNLEALMCRPLLVQLLLARFVTAEGLGSTRHEIYQEGIRVLLGASDETAPNPELWWRTAEHLALETILSATTAFPLETNDLVVAKVLRSGLFVGDVSHRTTLRVFRHRTFAEHLAATALARLCKTPQDLEAFRIIVDGAIPPQLNELAARLAEISTIARNWVIAHQPEVLTSSDPIAMSESFKEITLSAILEACADGKLMPNMSGWESKIGVLVTEGSLPLLESWIRGENNRGRSAALLARRTAFNAAKQAHAFSLSKALVDVALTTIDNRDDPDIPTSPLDISAGNAFLRLWESETITSTGGASTMVEERLRLRKLLNIPPTSDRNLDHRGLALSALWPDALSFAELTDALVSLATPGFYGFYENFLEQRLPQSYSRPDVVAGLLHWYANLDIQDSSRFGKSLAVAAWNLRTDGSVRKALIEATIRRKHADRSFELPRADSTAQSEARREFTLELIQTIATLPDDDKDKLRWTGHSMIWLWAPELFAHSDLQSDLRFWLQEHERSRLPIERGFYTSLIWRSINIENDDDINLLREHSRTETESARDLREQFCNLLDKKELRRVRNKRRAARQPDTKLLAPEVPAVDRFRAQLGEAENDPSAKWWTLLLALTGRDDQEGYGNPLTEDLSKLWLNLQPEEQKRAVSVLRAGLSDPTKTFLPRNQNGTVARGTLYAVRSLALLAPSDPSPDMGLDNATWKRLAAAILEHGDVIPREHLPRVDAILRKRIPTLGLQLFESVNIEQSPSSTASRLLQLWTREVSEVLLVKLADASLPTAFDLELLWRLTSQGDAESIQIARARLSAVPSLAPMPDSSYMFDETMNRQYAGVLALAAAPEASEESLLSVWVPVLEKNSGMAFRMAVDLGRVWTDPQLNFDKIDAHWLLRIWRAFAAAAPPGGDLKIPGAHAVTEREYAEEGRETPLKILRARASVSDVAALRTLATEYGSLDLAWMASEAEQRRRRNSWSPLDLSQLHTLLGRVESGSSEAGSRALEPARMIKENIDIAASPIIKGEPATQKDRPRETGNTRQLLVIHADSPDDTSFAMGLVQLVSEMGAEPRFFCLDARASLASLKDMLMRTSAAICLVSTAFVEHRDVHPGPLARLLHSSGVCILRITLEPCLAGPAGLSIFPNVRPSEQKSNARDRSVREAIELLLDDCGDATPVMPAVSPGKPSPDTLITKIFPNRLGEGQDELQSTAITTDSVLAVTDAMMRQKIVSVEGAAWTGKSVAVRMASQDLGWGSPRLITCGVAAGEPDLDTLISCGFHGVSGVVRIDDTHILADQPDLMKRLGRALKVVDENGRDDLRVVLLGQPEGDLSLRDAHPDLNLPEPVRIQETPTRTIRDRLFLQIVPERSGLSLRYPGLFALTAGGSMALAWRLVRAAAERHFPRGKINAGHSPLMLVQPADILISRPGALVEEAKGLLLSLLKAMADSTSARSLVFHLLWRMGATEASSITLSDLGTAAHIGAWKEVTLRISGASVLLRRRVAVRGSRLFIYDALASWGLPLLDWPALARTKDANENELVAWDDHNNTPSFRTTDMPMPNANDDNATKFPFDIVLRSMRGNGEWASVFVLGCHEKRVSFIAQQSRAINLVYALHETGCLPTGKTVAIIGGGVAGVTAAIAFGLLGTKVTLFEENSLLHLQKQADDRWLHPGLFEWPDIPLGDGDAKLPFLNWEAGKASKVRNTLLDTFRSLSTSLPTIEVKQNETVSSAIHINGRLVLHHGPLTIGSPFDLVVLAVGFGREKQAGDLPGDCSPSYWANDGLMFSGHDDKIVMVSGGGDGALVDLVREAAPGHEYEQIVARLAEHLEGSAYARAIRDAGNYDRACAIMVPVGLAKAVLGPPPTKPRTIFWNLPLGGYSPDTALLHRVLLHLLIDEKRISVSPMRGHTIARWDSGKKAIRVSREKAKSSLEAFVDIYVARWGPERPKILQDDFSEVMEAVEAVGEGLSDAERREVQTVHGLARDFFANRVKKMLVPNS